MTQDGAQAQAWYARAEACFGKGYEDLRTKAARCHGLAAAGHLPVPPPPPSRPAGSRFFKSGGTSHGPRFDDALVQLVGGMLEVSALSAAYLIAHPEVAAQMSVPNAPAGGSAPDWNQLQDNIRTQHNIRKVWAGECKPPDGCL